MLKHTCVKQALKVGLVKKSERKLKSLMPLRAGHQALLLASGIMDGVYEYQGHTVIVKGTVSNQETETVTYDESGNETITKTKRPVATVYALDLDETRLQDKLVTFSFK